VTKFVGAMAIVVLMAAAMAAEEVVRIPLPEGVKIDDRDGVPGGYETVSTEYPDKPWGYTGRNGILLVAKECGSAVMIRTYKADSDIPGVIDPGDYVLQDLPVTLKGRYKVNVKSYVVDGWVLKIDPKQEGYPEWILVTVNPVFDINGVKLGHEMYFYHEKRWKNNGFTTRTALPKDPCSVYKPKATKPEK
jgi:hypothetical protein